MYDFMIYVTTSFEMILTSPGSSGPTPAVEFDDQCVE